jgi:4-oxalocrotonate tautomerase
MPHVQITLLEGRTPEQKRKVAEGITRILVEEAGARSEAVSIAFLDVRATDFARAGVLVADQKRAP